MSVGTFDPGASTQPVDPDLVRELLVLFDGEAISLDKAGELRFSILARHGGWREAAEAFSDDELVALARVFTLLERQYTTFSAGSDSPVITIVSVLKQRGRWDKTLTQWVKANTENRFLPHGSLMDRL